MTRVVLDSETLTKLHGLKGTLELCDEDGRLLAVAVPLSPDELLVSSISEIQPSADEIRDLKKQPEGRPLKDLLADLEESA